jgi:hypothetical protein
MGSLPESGEVTGFCRTRVSPRLCSGQADPHKQPKIKGVGQGCPTLRLGSGETGHTRAVLPHGFLSDRSVRPTRPIQLHDLSDRNVRPTEAKPKSKASDKSVRPTRPMPLHDLSDRNVHPHKQNQNQRRRTRVSDPHGLCSFTTCRAGVSDPHGRFSFTACRTGMSDPHGRCKLHQKLAVLDRIR